MTDPNETVTITRLQTALAELELRLTKTLYGALFGAVVMVIAFIMLAAAILK